ncbi:MAG: YihY/virulence factor BrkB family protein, partial [Bdellovibrionales bacterium]|nr:YihY/virulence factor BrkB family protein [Bdellovibrionales bacterium]
MTLSSVKHGLCHIYYQIRDFIFIIFQHHIFFHSSSVSYYAALSIAPFLLILLQIAALLGQELQLEVINQTYFVLGSEVGKIAEMIFSNANKGINLASISGVIGLIILLFTASVVFMQIRFSLDSIYGHYDPERTRSIWEIVKERIFSMGVVILTGAMFFISIFASYIVKYFVGTDMTEYTMGKVLSYLMSFLINLMMFSFLYYFAPSITPKLKSAIKIAVFTSVTFIFGKLLIGLYFKTVAVSSVYGATGTLLVFLIWAYYSAFMLFLSVEGFLFLNPQERIFK